MLQDFIIVSPLVIIYSVLVYAVWLNFLGGRSWLDFEWHNFYIASWFASEVLCFFRTQGMVNPYSLLLEKNFLFPAACLGIFLVAILFKSVWRFFSENS